MRVLLTCTLLLTLLLAAFIGLIHAQPYDDRELRPLLSPADGCPIPCFMGIRPGVTRIDEAVKILGTHEWVRDYTVHVSTYGGVLLMWRWSGQQPDFIDSRVVGGLSTGNTNRVARIDIGTRVPLGSFVSWQSPDGGGLRCTSASRIMGLFVYYQEGFFAEVTMSPVRCLRGGRCPLAVHDLWSYPSQVTLGDNYLPHVRFDGLLRSLGCDYAE